MNQTNPSSQTNKTRTRLFHFTDIEEKRIQRAIEQSKRFMESYGQGRKPYMINLKNYL